MITDQDVEKLKKTFVTKKEHQQLVEKVDSLVYEVGDLKVGFAELNDKIDSLDSRLGARFDSFLGIVETLMIENKTGAYTLERHGRQINALASHTGTILPV